MNWRMANGKWQMEPVNMVAPILHGGTHKNDIYMCVLFGPCSALF